MEERLHKLLARHGIGSRRQAESWIAEGRVLVNGRPAEVGQQVKPGDRVVVDGKDVTKRLAFDHPLQVIVYHKPGGEMLRPQAGDERAGVEARLPSLRGGRWLPVNSLGFGEDGLLIMASDGAFVTGVTRQAHSTPVEYRVRALRPRLDDDWPTVPCTVDLAGETVEFSAVERLEGGATNAWFRIASARTLPKGAIRELFDAAGLKVSRTMLVQWGPVTLPRDLPRGRSRELSGEELDALVAMSGIARPASRPAARRTTGRRSGGR